MVEAAAESVMLPSCLNAKAVTDPELEISDIEEDFLFETSYRLLLVVCCSLLQADPMSSTSFKNAIRRREHFERHQPAARANLGLLEKHKDYVQRARNYHDKEKRITELRKKASNRNPDEFYHGMMSSKTKKGIDSASRGRGKGGNTGGGSDSFERPTTLTADMLALLKTQDIGYIRTIKAAEVSKLEKAKSALHVKRNRGQASRIVFNENGKAVNASGNDADEDDVDEEGEEEEEEEEMIETKPNLKRSRLAANIRDEEDSSKVLKKSKIVEKAAAKAKKALWKANVRAYSEIEAKEERVKKLSSLEMHMDLSRKLLTSRGKRVKVADPEGDSPAVYRWKQERKR